MTMIFHLKSLCCVFLLFGVVLVGELGKLSKAHRINTTANISKGQQCIQPFVDLYHPNIMKFLKDSPPLVCNDVEDWVQINGSVAFVTKEAKEKFGFIECSFKDIIWRNYDTLYFRVTTKVLNEYHLKNSDFVDVHCTSEKGKIWENVMAGIRHDQSVLKRTGWNVKDGLRLNVLIWIYDSLSRNMFARKLPKTLRYMRETLGAIELQGYNIVGDGSAANVIPLLTGFYEDELPGIRRTLGSKAAYADVYPLIWNVFRDRGYVTGYTEDVPGGETFFYLRKGFKAAPTDHFARPFYLIVSEILNKHRTYCLGSVPRHKVMMNYIHNFFKVYRDKPKFMFGFYSEISHDDYNAVSVMDKDSQQWLQTLRNEGHLNSTLLIIMSDHGHRYSEYRNTLQGKQEERMPMFSLIFPEWFRRVYPAVIENLRRNIMRLSTPFDVHETLANILHFDGAGQGDIRKRSISLFKEIPLERTCADAGIEPHWCSCYDWQEVNVHNCRVVRAAKAFVDFINQITETKREICSLLKLEAVLEATKFVPNQPLRQYRRNISGEFFVSSPNPMSEEIYQLKLLVNPGAALYEVTLTYIKQKDRFFLRPSDISRINSYGKFAYCVLKTYTHIGQYCFCHEKASDKNMF